MLLLDALVKLGASLDTQRAGTVGLASLRASDSGQRSRSLHAANRRLGVAVVVGPGSVQVWNQSVAMYISTARASSSSMLYPLVKLTLEGQKRQSLSPFSCAPFFNHTTVVGCLATRFCNGVTKRSIRQSAFYYSSTSRKKCNTNLIGYPSGISD